MEAVIAMVCKKKMGGRYYVRVEPMKRCSDEEAPADVPEGSLAVYVGPEKRRFVIQTEFLYKRVFRELLRKSEEEYGFEPAGGGLRIACDAELFEQLLWQLEAESIDR